jgi:class 3 adenylate cyclase/tetratricopeptide (TPR) repeat protein/ABC-type transport system involved in cytochrome c biogenesis ATPase subunit
MKDIAEWLASIGLGEYAQRFAENRIDASVLRDLTDQDLEKIGIPLGHRKKMLRAIAELGGAVLTTPQAVTGPNRQDTAERRHLTVMICDLVGSTALSARLDPEDMRAVIDAYHAACARITRTYDGFLAEFRGDGILAYFGYPLAHEDDAERTVRVGLDIIAAVAELKTPAAEPLAVRIGIATGLVVVGDLSGEGALRKHALVGDTPNVAARLQALAEPGTIVVGASTRRLLGNLFRLRDLGRHELKGIAEPVAAWAVKGVSASESRFEVVRAAGLTDLIGRQDEINFLLERQRLAWKGEGQIVLISGEPGIGKSRLTAALAERIAGEPHRRVRYQCSPYHTSSALRPFITQLERAAGFKTDDTSDQRLDKLEAVLAMGASRIEAPLFAALLSIPFGERYPPLALSPTQQRRRTLAALLDQFEGLARQEPTLLFFEDSHWADATSLELLDLIIERVRELPVLALFTFRPDFEPPWVDLPNVSTLTLGRLDRSEVESMIARVTGGRPLPAEVREQIVVKTDGNPLFVEELTKAVLEAGIVVEDAEGYRLDGPLPPLAIPGTLHDSLMARLDRLAPVKEICQIGAAIGREFSYPLLRALVGRDETALKDALAQLEDAELVFRREDAPEAIYSFKHALVQEVAYENLLKSRRQVLHRRIAETLRDRFSTIAEVQPEVVAHHFTQAGLSEVAIEWWVKAGDRALDRSANNEAIAHLEKAISLAGGLADGPAQRLLRLRLQTTYGHALLHGRGHSQPETIAAFARARELAAGIEDAVARFSAYYGMWMGSFVRADLAPMREVALLSLRDARHSPGSPAAGRALHVFGVTCWFQGDYCGARTHLEQALAAYDQERDHGLTPRFVFDDRVVTTGWLAVVVWALGKVDQGIHLLDSALSFARQSGHLPTIAWVHAYRCRFAGICRKPGLARLHAEEVLRLAREHGLPMRLADGSFYHGWARWCAGDGDGEAAMREGLALWNEMHYRLFAPLTGTLLAECEAEAGRAEVGLATLDAQLAAIEQTGERWFDAEVHRVRGKLLLKQRRPDVAAAEAAFMRAIEIARSQQTRIFELRAALSLAKLYQTTGRHQVASELLVPALVGFNAGPEVPEVQEAQRLLTMHEPVARLIS